MYISPEAANHLTDPGATSIQDKALQRWFAVADNTHHHDSYGKAGASKGFAANQATQLGCLLCTTVGMRHQINTGVLRIQ